MLKFHPQNKYSYRSYHLRISRYNFSLLPTWFSISFSVRRVGFNFFRRETVGWQLSLQNYNLAFIFPCVFTVWTEVIKDYDTIIFEANSTCYTLFLTLTEHERQHSDWQKSQYIEKLEIHYFDKHHVILMNTRVSILINMKGSKLMNVKNSILKNKKAKILMNNKANILMNKNSNILTNINYSILVNIISGRGMRLFVSMTNENVCLQ